MAAAAELFEERGVADVSVADITGAAGAAKGTFYLYFPSRHALIASVQEELAAEMTDVMADAADGIDGGCAAVVTEQVRAIIEFWRRHARRLDLLFHPAVSPGEIDPAINILVGALTRTISDGARAGEIEVDDPPRAASLLFGAVRGGIQIELQRGRPQWARLHRATEELVDRLLQPAA